MKMLRGTRRTAVLSVAVLLLAGGRELPAADYPAQPVKIVVPFAAGGGVDVVARIIGPKLSEALGQPVVIENRPGAGGSLAATNVAQAAPDGYTLLLGTGSTHGTNPNIYARINYDPVRDFAPIALLSASPLALLVNPSVPANSAKDLIALAKGKPGELAYGSYGVGSINHLAAELFSTMTGVQANHVPYRGSSPMLTDLIAGRIQYAFDGISTSLGFVQAGSVRILGVSGATRSSAHPGVPTIAESGVPGYDTTVWFGLFAPAGTPKAVVDLLNSKANAALATAAVKEGLNKLGNEVVGGTPEILGEKVQSEVAKWAAIVREKNIRVEP